MLPRAPGVDPLENLPRPQVGLALRCMVRRDDPRCRQARPKETAQAPPGDRARRSSPRRTAAASRPGSSPTITSRPTCAPFPPEMFPTHHNPLRQGFTRLRTPEYQHKRARSCLCNPPNAGPPTRALRPPEPALLALANVHLAATAGNQDHATSPNPPRSNDRGLYGHEQTPPANHGPQGEHPTQRDRQKHRRDSRLVVNVCD